MPEIKAAIARGGLKDRVLLPGFVPDAELVHLYRRAYALVQPSLMEGFGLPPVEAMACGTPVVSSRAGSLPEVVGDAGLFFDPTDVDIDRHGTPPAHRRSPPARRPRRPGPGPRLTLHLGPRRGDACSIAWASWPLIPAGDCCLDSIEAKRASRANTSVNNNDPIGTKTIGFKNVIYEYKLAQAMADGFVKEPAIATKQNFRVEDYKDRPDELELVKLEDGVCLHEDTKAELKVYAEQHGKPFVKPFMLVIAKDVDHAEKIVTKIKSDDFFNGDYKDKVITVHSTLSGDEKEETIAELLSVESPTNKTEIVVHVNMLKAGWDVTNLYTVVPLRKADSRTLVEQSIGRGLRLPYGQRTGVLAVDRLAIVAHDKFQEIIDEANKPGSPINFKLQTIIIGKDVGLERKVTKIVAPTLAEDIARTAPAASGTTVISTSAKPSPPTFSTDTERKVAEATIEVIREFERDTKRVPTTTAIRDPVIQAEITKMVSAAVAPMQMEFEAVKETPDIPAVVSKTTDLFVRRTIGIPRIIVVPKGEVTTGYEDFDLVLTIKPQPMEQAIVLQELRTGHRTILESQGLPETEERLEDYLVSRLIDFDDICYTLRGHE